MDAHGRVVEVYGRKIGERLRAGTPTHLFLPGPHRGVFNLVALQAGNLWPRRETLMTRALRAQLWPRLGFRSPSEQRRPTR